MKVGNMYKIRIKILNSNYFEIDKKELDEVLRNKITTILSYYLVKEYSVYKSDFKKEKKFFEETEDSFKIMIGLIRYIVKLFAMNTIIIENISDINNMVNSTITINDKWKKILDSDFRVVDGKNQYEVVNDLIKSSRSCAQIYTGYGKTELFLSILESYLDQEEDKNVILLVPSLSIKDEILERCEKYNVDQVNFKKFNTRCTIINPTGNKKLLEKYKDYLNNVGLILIDECHHLSAKDYMNSVLACDNYDFIYGLSGTLDPDKGDIPDIKEDISKYSIEIINLVSLLGYPNIIIRNPDPLKVVYMSDGFSQINKFDKWTISNYRKSITKLFKSILLAEYICKFLSIYSDRFIYIPIINKEDGEILMKNINKILGNGTAIIWTSGNISHEDAKNLEDLKEIIRKDENFRVLISTSVSFEGVDMKTNSSRGINTIFSGIGRNMRVTFQTKGRISRDKESLDPVIIFPYDTSNNFIVNKQSKEKLNLLKREHSNIEVIKFEDIILNNIKL